MATRLDLEHGYRLISKSDLRPFIDLRPNLPRPGIRPRAADYARVQSALLAKIEELTLYLLTQEERLSELRGALDSVTDRLDRLERASRRPQRLRYRS